MAEDAEGRAVLEMLRGDVWETFEVVDAAAARPGPFRPEILVALDSQGRVPAADDPRAFPVRSPPPPEFWRASRSRTASRATARRRRRRYAPPVEARQAAEQAEFRKALAATQGHVGAAARLPGVSRTTLWEKMRRYAIRAED
ncbi:MAG: hypothetical protein EA355_16145 [Rhodobacteraceae bacterium]|nr:MAG: hypothetical protein EA355_16145 [Paracoccaceae bacterium]